MLVVSSLDFLILGYTKYCYGSANKWRKAVINIDSEAILPETMTSYVSYITNMTSGGLLSIAKLQFSHL